MRTALSLIALGALAGTTLAQPKLPNLPPDLMAPTDPLTPTEERKQFTVPAGFDVQLVASEPDIQKPIQMAFDAKGRLWVTTSYHYPFAAQGKASDKLFVLSDFDPATGKARKIQTFADDLNIPIGILPLPDCNSCIVSSVGEIRKYTDTTGAGKADKMEVLYKGFGFRDTHGMYNSFTLMPDGWVYACHGFSNDSTVKGTDGHEVKMQSGNTFRFKPDGSRIEVWTRGQVNPFGMAVDPWFNLYTADCHSKPITQLIPGAYYDSFGKPHDGLGYAPHVTHHDHGSTALCGLTWYDADHFPKEYKGTMFLGNVVTNRINFDVITWKGASPVAKEQPDFLVSKDRWFRPADIKLGPDGALYVSDFYNKIIGHYEVDLKDPRRDKDRGRVWRIVWKGMDGNAPAPKLPHDFTTANLQEVISDATRSPNATVRGLATQQALLRLQKEQKAAEATEAFVTLTTDAIRDSNAIPEDGAPFRHRMLRVRLAAAKATWSDDEKKRAVGSLADENLKLRRAWVDAVTAHPHADFVKPLIEILRTCDPADAHLRMAAKIAMRNCFLVAPGNVSQLVGADEKTDLLIVEVLLGTRTPSGAGLLVAIARERNLPGPTLAAVAELVGRYANWTDRGQFASRLAMTSHNIVQNPEALLSLVRGVQASDTKLSERELRALFSCAESVLVDGLGKLIDSDKPFPAADTNRIKTVLNVVSALPPIAELTSIAPERRESVGNGLARIAGYNKAPADLRAACAETYILIDAQAGYVELHKLLNAPETSSDLRERLLVKAAASTIPDAQLDARDGLKGVPYRAAVPISLALAGTKNGADLLLTAIKEGKAPPRLLQEKAILERLKASNAPDWQKRVADLTKNLAPADQRLAALIKTRADGFAKAKPDKVEGAKLFTKHCAACHRVGDAGGKIAPQLDGIGVRGAERLLEDVLDPNRNVDQAFRARSITLTNEKTLTALMLRVEGEVLVVADLEGKEQRIPLKEIAVNRETMLSGMPANFADVIPEADLYHILAYLLDQKAKDPPKK